MLIKSVQTSVLLIVLLVIAQCGHVSTPNDNQSMPQEPASDFGFRFAYGACGTDILDTFAGTYTKDMLGADPITIPLTLSSEEQARIYAKMRDIHIFAYPATYAIDVSNAGEVGQVIPATTYSISIRSTGQTHTVTWLDNITKPTAPEADRLRELFQLIVAIINQQQKVQQLPIPQAGCA